MNLNVANWQKEKPLIIKINLIIMRNYATDGGPLNPKEIDWAEIVSKVSEKVYSVNAGKMDFTANPVSKV